MPPALGLLLGLSLVGALRPGLEPQQYNPTEEDAARFAGDYNSTAEVVLFESVSASWNYNTNLTAENAALQVGGRDAGDATAGVSPAAGTGVGGLGHGGDTRRGPLPPHRVLSWHPGAGTRSPGTAGLCPQLALRAALPQSDSPGPRAVSALFLEVIPSSQHLPISFPTPHPPF